MGLCGRVLLAGNRSFMVHGFFCSPDLSPCQAWSWGAPERECGGRTTSVPGKHAPKAHGCQVVNMWGPISRALPASGSRKLPEGGTGTKCKTSQQCQELI